MEKWQEKTDVIVVGSGAAGLSAAIEARKAGASVAVFEKMKITGGNTRISDGGLSAACNFLQRKKGVEDSPRSLFEDMVKAGLGLNHSLLAMIVAVQSADAVDWTMDVLGVKYMDRLDRFGGHSKARTVTTRSHSGVDIVKGQMAVLNRSGVEIRTNCLLDEIVVDGDGRVCGVEILSGFEPSGGGFREKVRVGAKKAVVIASGGFGSDVAFRSLQNPALDGSIGSTNHRGATAEAMGAAFKRGAAPVHLSWIQMGPWGCADEKGYGRGGRFASYAVFPRGIVVAPGTGRRIVNEWSDRKTRSNAMLKTGGPCLGIVDSKGAESDLASLAICLKRGKIKKFVSIADLAAACCESPGDLEKTVARYNEMVREKVVDEFGKNLADSAGSLENPPFYCMRLQPKVHYTPGGLGIDEKARVLDIKGRPIPGLFAAGEVCGGIHGADRLGGCALVECIVFGRIAGREAAAATGGGEE